MRNPSYLSLCVALVLCLQSVIAVPPALLRRQGIATAIAPASADAATQPSLTVAPFSGSIQFQTSSDRPSPTPNVSMKASNSSSISLASATATINSSLSTASPTPNPATLLPIKPKLTPAIGISGAVLLISGFAYCIIGVKNKLGYVFGSAAYLSSLAVTVLIVYLMSPPVSNAVQGGFFAAAFLTGIIFGVLSVVFSDITEGLGCLLGGFCLSMWFLSLKSGAVISSGKGRAALIGCFTGIAFLFSFSHYTRSHALLISTAFSGATIAVLGIDCLTSGGWKEFWLYIWNLNNNIFPLDTNTYPLTKSIKVELSGVVMIAILGIISQSGVKEVLQKRRAQQAADQLEEKQIKEYREAARSRNLERNMQQERVRWEGANNSKSGPDSSISSSFVSRKVSASAREMEANRYDSLEMITLPQRNALKSIDTEKPPVITSAANVPETDTRAITNSPVHGRTTTKPFLATRGVSLRPSVRAPPPVIAVPFTAPTDDNGEQDDQDDTSVSAEPEIMHESEPARRPLSNRISDLAAMRQRNSCLHSESAEALITIGDVEDNRASSVAATLDDDHDHISLGQITPPQSPKIAEPEGQERESTIAEVKDFVPSSLHTVDVASSNPKTSDEGPRSQRLSGSTTQANSTTKEPGHEETPGTQQLESDMDASATKSQAENGETQVVSLQDGNLPQRLSKVAMSYRTNEWAKHLELAEKPELEDLPVPASPGAALPDDLEEPMRLASDEPVAPVTHPYGQSRRTSGQYRPRTHSGVSLERSISAFSRESLEERQFTKSPSIVGSVLVQRPSTTQHGASVLPNNTLMHHRESLMKTRASSQSLTPNSSSANLVAEQVALDKMASAQRRQILQSPGPWPLAKLDRQASTTSLRKAPPSSSRKWQQKHGWSTNGTAIGFDSHQPRRVSNSQTDQKREELYAGWRDKMRDVSPSSAIYEADQQHQALMNERQQQDMDKQQREMMQQQRASQMDSMMRSGQMMGAHREAMRRMQAGANSRG